MKIGIKELINSTQIMNKFFKSKKLKVLMFKSTFRMFNSFPLTKYERIQRYIENLEDNITIKNKHDQKIISDIRDLISGRISSIRWLSYSIGFLYVLLYFSFVSFIFSDVFFIGEVVNIINVILGVLGTTMIVTFIYLFTRVEDMYYTDLSLLSSHLIAIYTKEGFSEDKMFEEVNQYEVYMKFFKRRGFMSRKK